MAKKSTTKKSSKKAIVRHGKKAQLKTENVVKHVAGFNADLFKEIGNRFGDFVRRHRAKQNITMEELAELSSMHRQAIQHIETGSVNCKLSTAFSISHALGVPLSRIIKEMEQEILGSDSQARLRKEVVLRYSSESDLLKELLKFVNLAISEQKQTARL